MALLYESCDRCGKRCKNDKQWFYGIDCGYVSPAQMQSLTHIVLCEKCFRKFSKKFDRWVNKYDTKQMESC